MCKCHTVTNNHYQLLTICGQVPVVLLLADVAPGVPGPGLHALLGPGVVVFGRHGLHVAPVPPPLSLAAGVRPRNHCVHRPAGARRDLRGLGSAIVVTWNEDGNVKTGNYGCGELSNI